jgi:hypothetical protein
MIGLQVNIVEYTDDHQPGWVRCQFVDAYGKTWNIIEKVPVVTTEDLDSKSSYPRPGFVAAEVEEIFSDSNNRELATINTNVPWGIWAQDGEFIFTVLKSQLINT